MPCDTRRKRGQSIQQRANEVRQVVNDVNSLIAAGKVKPVVDKKTGAVAFQGISDTVRDDVTDACIYRRLLVSGSSMTKIALQRAEMLAGRSISREALAQGHHSHDGGSSWHHGH